MSTEELIEKVKKSSVTNPTIQALANEAIKTVEKNLIPEVYLDIDGVLADFIGHLFRFLKYPNPPIITDYYDPRIVTNLYKVYREFDFWASIPPLVTEPLPTAHGYISSRQEYLQELTEGWLEKHPFFPPAPLISTHEYPKEEVIPKGAYFLDDNPDVLNVLRGSGVKCFLLDQPWNQNLVTEFRVFSVKEFYRLIPLH